MPALQISTKAKNARLQALADEINIGSSIGSENATLVFYTSPQAADLDTSIASQIPLCVATVPYPFEASIAAGSLTASGFSNAMATAAGTATWARLYNGSAEAVTDLTVGLPPSGANILISNPLVSPGVLIIISSVTIAEA